MVEAARPRARATLLTVGRAVLVVGGVLPWLLPAARALLPLGSAGAAIDLLFMPMCHRLPERTLSLLGVPMPLCSRCAGIFAGAAIGAAIARPRLSLPRWRWIIAATGALMLLDVVTQDVGLHPIWHATRVLTGALFGVAIAGACMAALRGETRATLPAD